MDCSYSSGRSHNELIWGRGSGGVKSAGVSQSVRETGRDESQCVPSPEKLFKTRDLELPIFEGSVPSCSPHSAGYTRTSVHPASRDQLMLQLQQQVGFPENSVIAVAH